MKNPLNNTDAELLLILQEGIPLEPGPFAVIGRRIGLSEEQVVKKAAGFIKDGLIRRFGAVFESSRLGYFSTLCATAIPEADLERLAAAVCRHPGITHCYERAGRPNLWLTMTAPADNLAAELTKISKLIAPFELFNFPARRTFKIGVVLDVRNDGQQRRMQNLEAMHTAEKIASAPKFDETECALIRILQGNLPLSSPDPLEPVAKEIGIGYQELLTLLAGWKEKRIIRRLGFIPNHHKLGFAVNVMCAWNVEPGRIEAAGSSLAQSPAVTHCYERVTNPSFPYNLFAMIHAGTHAVAGAICDQLAKHAKLSNGCMMLSLREFKKTSPVFFE